MASAVERSRSVSSMRSTNVPAWRRAYSQQNNAVRRPPICKKPVGLEENRVRTVIGVKAWKNKMAEECSRGSPLDAVDGADHKPMFVLRTLQCHTFAHFQGLLARRRRAAFTRQGHRFNPCAAPNQ